MNSENLDLKTYLYQYLKSPQDILLFLKYNNQEVVKFEIIEENLSIDARFRNYLHWKVFLKIKEDLIFIGNVKKSKDNDFLLLNFDRRMFKKHIYNTSELESEKNQKTFELNIKFIENIPEKIISSEEKDSLLNGDKKLIVNNYILSSYFIISLNLKNNKTTINYNIVLEESILSLKTFKNQFSSVNSQVFKVGTVYNSIFKRVLSVYLNNIVFKIFNKEYKKLNENEIKLLDIYLH